MALTLRVERLEAKNCELVTKLEVMGNLLKTPPASTPVAKLTTGKTPLVHTHTISVKHALIDDYTRTHAHTHTCTHTQPQCHYDCILAHFFNHS